MEKQTIDRAEEVISESYRLIRQARDSGERPKRLLIPARLWRMVEDYRKRLGVLEGPVPDYLEEDRLFGLEVWYDEHETIRID